MSLSDAICLSFPSEASAIRGAPAYRRHQILLRAFKRLPHPTQEMLRQIGALAALQKGPLLPLGDSTQETPLTDTTDPTHNHPTTATTTTTRYFQGAPSIETEGPLQQQPGGLPPAFNTRGLPYIRKSTAAAAAGDGFMGSSSSSSSSAFRSSTMPGGPSGGPAGLLLPPADMGMYVQTNTDFGAPGWGPKGPPQSITGAHTEWGSLGGPSSANNWLQHPRETSGAPGAAGTADPDRWEPPIRGPLSDAEEGRGPWANVLGALPSSSSSSVVTPVSSAGVDPSSSGADSGAPPSLRSPSQSSQEEGRLSPGGPSSHTASTASSTGRPTWGAPRWDGEPPMGAPLEGHIDTREEAFATHLGGPRPNAADLLSLGGPPPLEGPHYEAVGGPGVPLGLTDSPRWGADPYGGPFSAEGKEDDSLVAAFDATATAATAANPSSALWGGAPQSEGPPAVPPALPLSLGGGSFSLPPTSRAPHPRTVRLFRGSEGPPGLLGPPISSTTNPRPSRRNSEQERLMKDLPVPGSFTLGPLAQGRALLEALLSQGPPPASQKGAPHSDSSSSSSSSSSKIAASFL